MPENKAAFQPAKCAPAMEVRTAPYPKPGRGQIVIQNAAVAINPIDTLIQSKGNMMFTYLKYPFVLGYDMAGEVVAAGPGVTRLKVGDRVLGFSRAGDKNINDPAQGAFQKFAVVYEYVATELPSFIDYEHAATLPLTLITAGAALFDKAQLGLPLPTEPRGAPNTAADGKPVVVVVWGASTSVGCNAVQLAVAAGCEVLATAGGRNRDAVLRLGASQVWDYRAASTAVDEIVRALAGRTLGGVVSIGAGAAEKCIQITTKARVAAGSNRHVAMATFPMPEKEPQSFVMLRTVATFVSSLASYSVRGAVRGFKWSLVDTGPTMENGVARHIFAEYLPKALAAGTFVPAPEPEVVGHGLEHVQTAFERLRGGVSFKKLVVTL
ncbi:hypothetical protein SCUCBS95973_004467 [Sporothrix curviconia]|uniref:Enoyl reductase (ER) domain-containing protein n=1 Tax=Sporothrix curviconia TaxID=1260050 RepID=A0ABP0BP22_9PEZI